MGSKIGELFRDSIEERELEELGKVAIDAYNSLYGFLSNIRQSDGEPLMDSKGRVTSHISGLLYRNAKLMESEVKPCYVFDGKTPDLKEETVKKRRKKREKAKEKYKEAKRKGKESEALKYAKRTAEISSPIVKSSKELLNYLGIPSIQAPKEGEAQAAHMAKKGEINYVGSQDYDSLLFGAPKLARNVAIKSKDKIKTIDLERSLEEMDLTREELIEIAILSGTDYNEGIKGVGPQKALSIVKGDKKKSGKLDVEKDKIKKMFLSPEVTDSYKLKWKEPDRKKAMDFLHRRHDFSKNRVKDALDRIEASTKQSSLDNWT